MAAVIRITNPNPLDDYWTEFHDIESNKDPDEEEDLPKTPDEGEQEAVWLRAVGLDSAVNQIKDGKELTDDDVEALVSTLTTSQAAVVKRRVDTLNSTLRKKQKHGIKTDVRDIFPSSKDPAVHISGQTIVEDAEHAFPSRRGSRTRDRGGFLKRGGYSMSGRKTDEFPGTAESDECDAEAGPVIGIEMLSMQPKGTFHRPLGNRASDGVTVLPSISDHEDIMFEIKMEDKGHSKEQQRLASLGSQQRMEENLPNFSLVQDKLGITRIGDLSAADIAQIRSLALIELTAMFDSYNITYSHRKAKKKAKDNGLFGVALDVIVENDQKIHPDTNVPMVFKDIIGFLEKHCLNTEGILRVPGSTGRIKQLRLELEEKFYTGTFSWIDVMPNDAAALLKQFLRELPVPLLTYQYIEAFAQVENIKDKKLQLQALSLLIILLPNIHRNTLRVLLRFLNNVVAHSNDNKMGLTNVAMIMAPNLFLAPTGHSKNKGIRETEINMAAGTSNIVRMLIRYRNLLWTVPSFLVQQMRRQNELKQQRQLKEKTIKKFLAKKDKSELYKKANVIHEGDFDDGVIRVHAPFLTKSSTAIRLDDFTTAGHIVDRFRKSETPHGQINGREFVKRRSNQGTVYADPDKVVFAEEDTHLYEVGGNIGERCLDHKTNMLALYQVNPNADWVIKSGSQR